MRPTADELNAIEADWMARGYLPVGNVTACIFHARIEAHRVPNWSGSTCWWAPAWAVIIARLRDHRRIKIMGKPPLFALGERVALLHRVSKDTECSAALHASWMLGRERAVLAMLKSMRKLTGLQTLHKAA